MERKHFKISRASEYFDPSELSKRTGMSRPYWTEALLKELTDNSLDILDGREDPEIEIRSSNDNISVWDNGPGMSVDLISSILDFDSRTSDKFAYMGPTRGQQGNAFKTFLGIAYNFGGHVEIESQGLKHTIRCKANPAGDVDVDHRVEDYPCTGTKITIHSVTDLEPEFEQWVFNYHLVNPFVQITYFQNDDLASKHGETEPLVLYKSGSLDKIKVTDSMSPHWFDAGKFCKLAYLSEKEGVPLGQFIGSFHGLKTSKKKKAVAAGLDMTTIASDQEQAQGMLNRMKAESRPIKPNKLGMIGEKTLTDILEPDRHWYRKICGVQDGKPWAFEIIAAECNHEGCFTAVNHSITFVDFVSDVLRDGWLHAWSIRDAARGVGANFLLAHYIGISPEFRSLGKDSIALPKPVLAAIAKQTRLALTTLHNEQKKTDREDEQKTRDQINRNRPEKEMPLAEVIPLIIDEAIEKASEGGKYNYSFRDLYYAARALVQQYTTKEMKQPYFSKQCDKHWRGQRPTGCLYDPRGFLYEPHTNNEIQLGTEGVSNYHMPAYCYNKVLYVEKKGVLTAIKEAGLPEKYDMAIIATEGFATVAARTVMNMAQDKDFTIFVFHDADPAGYEIARTIEQETAAMPNNRIEIVDIGLDIQTCVDMDLLPEFFTRKKALPSKQNFNEIELEYFIGKPGWYRKNGKQKKCWNECQRFEINALLPGDRVAYIDEMVGAAVAGYDKVIPPDDVQRKEAEWLFSLQLDKVAANYFAKKISKMQDRLRKKFSLPENRELEVAAYLKKHKFATWENGVEACTSTFMNDLGDEIKEVLTAKRPQLKKE